VKVTDSVEESATIIRGALEGVLAELVEHSTDEALRSEWLSGSSPGIGNMQRLLFGAILVNEIGPSEKLGGVIRELRGLVSGSVHEGLVEGRLARASVRVQ
jgi:hypothetical protein